MNTRGISENESKELETYNKTINKYPELVQSW